MKSSTGKAKIDLPSDLALPAAIAAALLLLLAILPVAQPCSGGTMWKSPRVAVSTEGHSQTDPVIASGGCGADKDLYAQRIGADGVMGGARHFFGIFAAIQDVPPTP